MKRRIKFGCRITRALTTRPADGVLHAVREDGSPYDREVVLSAYDRVDWNTVKSVALECERLGYDTLIVPDHMMLGGERLESWTTLAALGALTSKIRLGELVLCIFYRGNPAIFAKQVATLDVITGGRVDIGLGAGYERVEFDAFGIPFPKASKRIKMLEEYVEILKRMWTQEKATYQGEFYRVKDASCAPKPVQKPHPPITIGGTGPKLLRVAAKHADWVNVYGVEPAETQGMLKILEEHCNEIGRDPKEVGKSWGEWVVLLPTKAEVERLSEKLRNSPYTWHGTPSEYLERVRSFVDMGITYVTPRFVDLPDMTSLRLFAKEIIPAFT